MARNRYPGGFCYCCGIYVSAGYGYITDSQTDKIKQKYKLQRTMILSANLYIKNKEG